MRAPFCSQEASGLLGAGTMGVPLSRAPPFSSVPFPFAAPATMRKCVTSEPPHAPWLRSEPMRRSLRSHWWSPQTSSQSHTTICTHRQTSTHTRTPRHLTCDSTEKKEIASYPMRGKNIQIKVSHHPY